ncbi:hypothetical protein [Pelagicoccus albus]|uniref:Secreted protein n=1 Tax=Pelagicoccus albus TaxID=415222 RepID=A0A7X1EB36_9BACT|nr:hypothetical protein [Pelagicoccus albus]MBC2607372.1 hypothetical protein [Pelagicoccus albus]
MPFVSSFRGVICAALFSIFVGSFSIDSFAAAPADSQIKSALVDIEKFEAQITPAFVQNSASVRRTRNLLKLTRQRLDASPNKSDASWLEADQRFNALIARLDGQVPQTPTAAPEVSISVQVSKSQANVAQSQMISQQRVRIQKLKRDIESATETMDKEGVTVFQDAAHVQAMDQRVARFRDALAKYREFAGDPDVEAARSALQAHESLLAFGKDHTAKQMAGLGDVQARLRAIDESKRRAPEPPSFPYEREAIAAWGAQAAEFRQEATAQLGVLQQIGAVAYLPNNPGTVGQGASYDKNDLNRLQRWFLGGIEKVEQDAAQIGANFDVQMGQILDTIAHFEALDPADPSDQVNAFLGQGVAKENWGRMSRDLRIASAAVEFDQLLERPQLQEHLQILQRMTATMEGFKAKHGEALSLSRMPESVSRDGRLLEIAHEVLSRPKYDIGEIRRVVINAELRSLEKETSETLYDDVEFSLNGDITLTGTKTTYFYEWEEFQVATAEPVEDRFFVFYNTLRHFTKGAPTTPTNRWIVAKRFQGSEILKENIDR